MNKRIVYIVNVDWFFISHRIPLALEAIKRGYEVFLVTKNTGKFGELSELGINCIEVNFERSGTNPFKELTLIFKLRAIYKRLQPYILHHVTLKPSIYGTIAARNISSNPKVINAVSGLGYSFTNNRKSLSKLFLVTLLKFAFKNKSANFIFQNPDDRDLYKKFAFLTKKNHIIIKGSGVDENVFGYSLPLKNDVISIIFLGRILKDKGVLEFINAANILKKRYYGKVKFTLVGSIDVENPTHITREALEALCDQDYIIWNGFSKNVKQCYQQADIVCLPSYREGLPKSLIEAMAIGRPIITTNTIGCRECVENGINGYLVPVKSVNKLAECMEVLILNKNLRLAMGLRSREKMVNEMSLSYVVAETFRFYE
jgi:glycosyltransferase involved in cell wall biosynthesis